MMSLLGSGPAETQIKLAQALSDFASKLGLLKGVDGSVEDNYNAVHKVRDWLNTTEHNFLLIFDNVEKAETLQQIWPASVRGSIIITTRSPAVASKRSSKLMQLECFTEDVGVQALYELTRKKPVSDDDAAAAKEICQHLGCLPLALNSISELIHNRGCSYEEFLALYKKSDAKIISRSEALVDYQFTLSTVWEFSLENLSPKASTLLNMLAFLDPDRIPESILTIEKAQLAEVDPLFEFLYDDLDGQEDYFPRCYNPHAVLRLPKYLERTRHRTRPWLAVLGEMQRSFAAGEPQVSRLMYLTHKYKLNPTDIEAYAELIFRAGTYLWEKEQPTLAQSFFDFGLRLKIDPFGEICAQAYRLSGRIGLDVAQPRTALAAFLKALEIREKLEEPNSPPIADVYDSVACSYIELGEVPKALDYLSRATTIHEKHGSRMSRTKAIYAVTYLRGNRPDDALAALKDCWKLQNLSQSEIELV